MIGQADILDMVRNEGDIALGPLELKSIDVALPGSGQSRADAVFLLRSGDSGTVYEFVAEVSSLGTPKAVKAAAASATRLVAAPGQGGDAGERIRAPLVIAPFLSEDRLTELAAEGVSGLDLCGNGVLVAEGLYVFKTGAKNRYPRSTRLQNAYRAKSSLVGRALLMQPEFKAVKDLVAFINNKGPAKGGRRDASISFSQVSKALKQMEEDVIVSREGGGVRLLQPDLLLETLVREYQPPRVIERWVGWCSDEARMAVLAKAQSGQADPENRYADLGYWVAGQVTGFAGEPRQTIFTDASPRRLLEGVPGEIEEGRRFANLEILRTHSDWVYFGRCEFGGAGVSETEAFLQLYLVLANGDTRQRQEAPQLKERILAGVREERVAS